VFAEHVAAPAGTALRRAQNGYAAVTRLFGAGIPHIAGAARRPTVEKVREKGLIP
jgi:hypothetical protein